MGAEQLVVGNRIKSPDKTARPHRTNAGTSAVSPFINTCGMSTRARLLISAPARRRFRWAQVGVGGEKVSKSGGKAWGPGSHKPASRTGEGANATCINLPHIDMRDAASRVDSQAPFHCFCFCVLSMFFAFL